MRGLARGRLVNAALWWVTKLFWETVGVFSQKLVFANMEGSGNRDLAWLDES